MCTSRVRRIRWSATDDGFTIIETLAALTVLAIVTIGVVPLFISGLRSSLASKFETQAKNLAQERLEAMRNLPFYLTSSFSPAASSCWTKPERTNPRQGEVATGAVECDYRDLLDTFYRSRLHLAPAPPAPPAAPSGGYVATDASRSADEIAAGLTAPYYRFVLNPVPNFQEGRFTQVVASQFLDSSRTVLAPSTTPAYNTQDSNADFPPSRLLGVTIITRWQIGSNAEKYVLSSQIAEGSTQPTVVTMEAEATALRLRTALDIANTTPLEAAIGLSRSEGTLALGPSASTYAQGGFASLAPAGERKDGHFATASAPPVSTSTGGTSGTVVLTGGSPPYEVAELAGTGTGNVTAGTAQEQPSVPSLNAGSDMSRGSLLKRLSAYDLKFTNTSQPASPMPGLRTDLPLVSAKGTGSTNTADGQTYLRSTSGTGRFAEAGASAALQETRFLPTVKAPNGIIQVVLTNARVTCKTTGSSTTGTTSSFSVQVKYFNIDQGSYVTFNYSYSPTTGLSPSTPLPNPIDIIIDSTSVPVTRLGDFIRDWGVAPGVTPSVGPGGISASITLNGVFRLTTQNTRPDSGLPVIDDNASAISATVGLLSCVAEDKRT